MKCSVRHLSVNKNTHVTHVKVVALVSKEQWLIFASYHTVERKGLFRVSLKLIEEGFFFYFYFFLKLRRPLLSIPRMQDECRGRQGARLSTTRRSIQPKNKAVDKGVYVCVTQKSGIYINKKKQTARVNISVKTI